MPGRVTGPRHRPRAAKGGADPGRPNRENSARPRYDARARARAESGPHTVGTDGSPIRRWSRRRVPMAAEPVVRRGYKVARGNGSVTPVTGCWRQGPTPAGPGTYHDAVVNGCPGPGPGGHHTVKPPWTAHPTVIPAPRADGRRARGSTRIRVDPCAPRGPPVVTHTRHPGDPVTPAPSPGVVARHAAPWLQRPLPAAARPQRSPAGPPARSALRTYTCPDTARAESARLGSSSRHVDRPTRVWVVRARAIVSGAVRGPHEST